MAQYVFMKVAYLPGAMYGMNPNGSNKRIIHHLVPDTTTNGDMASVALCGAKPRGRSYGWYPEDNTPASCERCKALTSDKPSVV